MKSDREYGRMLQQYNDLYERISGALALVESWATIDGAHHKQWLIDQMVRALLGDQYAEWVQQYNDDAATDTWDAGIAP